MLRMALGVMVGMVLMATVAWAGQPNSKNEVDISAVIDKLQVMSDGRGHYLVAAPLSDIHMTFYGTDKELYQQRVRGGATNSTKRTSERQFWEPVAMQGGKVSFTAGKWSVGCQGRETPLTAVSQQETARILTKAVFKRPKWKRMALFLARDNRGTYYYVDKLRDDRPANLVHNSPNRVKGHRLFVGKRGRVRLQRLSDATDDSSGVVLSYRGGALAINQIAKTAVLTKGRRETPLLLLEVDQNTALIYRDLGMYGALGTPCDDL